MGRQKLKKLQDKAKREIFVKTFTCFCGCNGQLVPAAINQWTSGGSNPAIG